MITESSSLQDAPLHQPIDMATIQVSLDKVIEFINHIGVILREYKTSGHINNLRNIERDHRDRYREEVYNHLQNIINYGNSRNAWTDSDRDILDIFSKTLMFTEEVARRTTSFEHVVSLSIYLNVHFLCKSLFERKNKEFSLS